MFAGRLDELRAIDHYLLQTKNGNPQHFLIEGERGIGKSSNFLCARLVGTGKMQTLNLDQQLDCIVISISLTDHDDYFSILRKIAVELKRQIDSRNTLKSLAMSAIDIISRFEVGGVRHNRDMSTVERDELFGTLQNDIVRLIENFTTEYGILPLIDEADKPSSDAGLGIICKLLTEELTRQGNERLCIGLAGLPDLIDKLRQSHESSLRLFQTLTLRPLEHHEREQVIESGMQEATARNGFPVTITEDAKKVIAVLSEGYPHFLQEFAYCAFEADDDNVIDQADVSNSLFRENGAFDQLGRKYFDSYYSARNSDAYRLMLDVMSDHADNWITRAGIIIESSLPGGTVDNGLRALRAKNLIVANEMKAGQYRLPTRSFAAWVKAKKAARETVASDAGPTLFDEVRQESSLKK
jgi:Cdc6-like AAA superfamily ATPase